jgi:hypothetical protein
VRRRMGGPLEFLRVSYALVACICTDNVMRVCRRVQCGGGWEDLQGNNYIAMWQRDLVFDKLLYRKHWKRGESPKNYLTVCRLLRENQPGRSSRPACASTVFAPLLHSRQALAIRVAYGDARAVALFESFRFRRKAEKADSRRF